MNLKKNYPLILGLLLILSGALALLFTGFLGWQLPFLWPLAMLIAAGLAYAYFLHQSARYAWLNTLLIPSAMLIALAFVFLLNVLTMDWRSWAYAWLLLIAAASVGILSANRCGRWPAVTNLLAWITLLASLMAFLGFGALTGGALYPIATAILLVLAGGVLLGLARRGSLPFSSGIEFSATTAANHWDPAQETANGELVEPLTERELEVLQLMDQGLSNVEIAEHLMVALSTVKTHVHHLYGKLGVRSRLQAVRQARKFGILRSRDMG